MGRRLTEPDRELVAAELTASELGVLEDWADALGVAPGDWWTLPPLRQLATMVAAARACASVLEEARLRGAHAPNLGDGEAMRRAAERLGLEDDADLATHPGDSLSRQLRRWKEAARGHDVRAPDHEAA
jgi:hypothetical protein